MNQKSRKYAELLGAVCGGLLLSIPAIPQEALAQLNPNPSIFSEPPYNRDLAPTAPGARRPRPAPPDGVQGDPVAPRPGARPPRPAPPEGIQGDPGAPRPGARPPRPAPPEGIQGDPVAPAPVPPDGIQGDPEAPPPGARPPRPNPDKQSKQLIPGSVSPDQLPRSEQLPPEPRQAPVATIALANGRVNVTLVNNTGANVTYQVIGDTAPRSLQGKSKALLQGLRVPTTVTFYREDGGLLAVSPQITSQQGILEVTLKETTDLGIDRGALRIAENGAVFLN